jgi:hypothetical protein
VASTALVCWETAAAARLDQLLEMHVKATGNKPGRRWETTQFNRSLMVILVGQFQAYCRDLHDCGVREHVAVAVTGQKQLLQMRLTEGRKLDIGNPRRSALGADFGRLGFRFIERLKAARSEAEADLDDLDNLVDYRNAVSHANETLIAGIEAGNRIRATKSHFVSNRKTLSRLAHTMDQVVANEVSALLGIPAPW